MKPDLILDIESDIIRFIDNNETDMLVMHKSHEGYETMLFGKDNFTELCKEFFGEEPEYIKTILDKINSITMEELLEDYKFNIGFKEGYHEGITGTLKQMETMFQDQSEEIAKELGSIDKNYEQI